MSKQNILKDKIGYQIFPLSFNDSNGDGIGDLKGIIEKLPYLKDLGVDIIWLCPIYKSNFVDAGYDVIDYCKIDPRFGTMRDFKKLTKAAKKLNMDIMMDFVINHASSDSYEFKEACKSRDNKYHDFFIWEDKPNLKDESIFGGSAWEYVESVDQYYLHIFTKEQADFNFHSEPFKKWLYKIFDFWIKKGVKYYRFDAIEHIGKTTKPYKIRYGKYNKELLTELSLHLNKKYDAYVVGESWNINPKIMYDYSNKDGIVDSFYNFSLLALDWKNPNGALAKVKNKVDYKDLKWYFDWQKEDLVTATSWTNHDVPRAIDRYFKTNFDNRYYAQTAMTTLLMTTKGIPFLYQGEEFGMSVMDVKTLNDFVDKQVFTRKKEFMKVNKYTEKEYFQANATGSRDLSRSIMSWENTINSGFTKVKGQKTYYKPSKNIDKINMKEDLSDPTKSIIGFTQEIIKLRKGSLNSLFTNFDKQKIIKLESNYTVFENIKGKKSVVVAINWSDKPVNFKKNFKEIVLSNYQTSELKQQVLKPFEATIYKK